MSTKKQFVLDDKTNGLLIKAKELTNLKDAEIARYAIAMVSQMILEGTISREEIIEKARLVTFVREK